MRTLEWILAGAIVASQMTSNFVPEFRWPHKRAKLRPEPRTVLFGRGRNGWKCRFHLNDRMICQHAEG